MVKNNKIKYKKFTQSSTDIDQLGKLNDSPLNPWTRKIFWAKSLKLYFVISNPLKKLYLVNSIKRNIYSVANKPGVKIYPGEINKAIEILREGKSINYEGVTNVEFDKFGDTLGLFLEVDLKKGKLKSKKLR